MSASPSRALYLRWIAFGAFLLAAGLLVSYNIYGTVLTWVPIVFLAAGAIGEIWRLRRRAPRQRDGDR